jgi:DNA (cytosine-5)-methyltransferase 1
VSFAYYNEHDPYAAQWLRNLITAGLIAPGIVDERSIEDVKPSELAGYTQCHFFAGVGVWSYALRRAGWPDDKPIWTGSCPCQPFSAAGKGDGFDDERHLWPAFHHLISQCRPGVVFGEQVASKDALAWIDLVHADLDATGYAFGAVDLCAAGFGAPHIRQRLFWVADSTRSGIGAGLCDIRPPEFRGPVIADDGATGRMGDDDDEGLEGLAGYDGTAGRQGQSRSVTEAGVPSRMADAECERPGGGRDGNSTGHDGALQAAGRSALSGLEDLGRPGPTNGQWRDADWLFCRDGKWRPVEPGTFPLAHGAPARVGRLRAYGNAIVAEVAEEFVSAYLLTKPLV